MIGKLTRVLTAAAGVALLITALMQGSLTYLYAGFALMWAASFCFAMGSPSRRTPLIVLLLGIGALALIQRQKIDFQSFAMLSVAVGCLWPAAWGAEILLAPCRKVYDRHASGMQASRVMAVLLMLVGCVALFPGLVEALRLDLSLPDKAEVVFSRFQPLSLAAFCVLMAMQPSLFTAVFACLFLTAEGLAGYWLGAGVAYAVQLDAYILCGALIYSAVRAARAEKARAAFSALLLCLAPCASLGLLMLRSDYQLAQMLYAAISFCAWQENAVIAALQRVGWLGWIGAGAGAGALSAGVALVATKHWTAACAVFVIIPAAVLLLLPGYSALAFDVNFYIALAICYLLCSLMTVALGRADA